MAGHSKWANIKHKKERADLKKGKLFSRISKEVINAVKASGPDPKANVKLKIAIQKAKDANFPSENIDRLIKKASQENLEAYHELCYELYGHGGVGIIVEIMTDNKNRIASEIRIATNKRGGTIAVPGAVSFNFDKKGIIKLLKQHAIEEELFQAATEAGAEDFTTEDEEYIITTNPDELYSIKEAIERLGFRADEAEVQMVPKTWLDVPPALAQDNLALIELLKGIDDVDHVFHNMKLPKEPA